MSQIRAAFAAKNYTLKPSGRFAVVNVGESKAAINAASLNVTIDFKHWPIVDPFPDPSHSGIFGYGADDLKIAVELKLLVLQSSVYPTVE